ncbi:hypothetical protein LTS18_007347, partial [Coniosporium uncinatum]
MCWCSNIAPADTTDVSNCNKPCPGFPYENCGSDNGLFGYIALSMSPSGTAAASTPTSTEEPAPPTSTEEPATSTSTEEPTTSPTPSTTDAPPPPPSTSAPPPSSSTTVAAPVPIITTATVTPIRQPITTWTPTPVTSVQLVTISGSAITQTVTNTPTSPSEALNAQQKSPQGGISSGAIAGAVVASILGTLAIVGVLLFFCIGRRTDQIAPTAADQEAHASTNNFHRNASVLSKMGLLEKRPPPTATSSTLRNSTVEGPDSRTATMSERRHSGPVFVDQRLNPTLMFAHENGSRASMMTIEDNQDYGRRVLGVVNPDTNRD